MKHPQIAWRNRRYARARAVIGLRARTYSIADCSSYWHRLRAALTVSAPPRRGLPLSLMSAESQQLPSLAMPTCRCRRVNTQRGCSPARWRCSARRCSRPRYCSAGSSGSSPPAAAPPAVPVVATTPTPSAASSASVLAHTSAAGTSRPTTSSASAKGAAGTEIVARPSGAQQQLDSARFVGQTQTHIATRWMEGFYPIYATAQRTFGVNWLLLASIHRQESAFSTAPGTYYGLNFAGCCGGSDAVQRHQRPGHDVASGQQLLPLRPAPARATTTRRQAPVDLRRLRLDHGRRPPALGRRRRLRARRLGLGSGL